MPCFVGLDWVELGFVLFGWFGFCLVGLDWGLFGLDFVWVDWIGSSLVGLDWVG